MTKDIKNIAVIGSGAWGTALAEVFADAGRAVTLYARSADLTAAIMKDRENALYLPGVALNAQIRAVHDMAAAVKDADLVVLAAPAQFFRATLTALKDVLPPGVPLVNAAKGIEIGTGLLPSAIAAEVAPAHPYAVLSGPTFAAEVARHLPAAVTFATHAPDGAAWAESLRGRAFRPYLSRDVAGAECAGAIKNVIAIACGIVEGKKLGQNARAAVMTRGMAEIRRFGAARGARPETLLGLSGLGDLTLTCNSMASRNFSLGAEAGAGTPVAQILSSRRSVAEGVSTARAVALLAAKENIDMPICRAVDHVLHGGGGVDEVIRGLLSRALKEEEA